MDWREERHFRWFRCLAITRRSEVFGVLVVSLFRCFVLSSLAHARSSDPHTHTPTHTRSLALSYTRSRSSPRYAPLVRSGTSVVIKRRRRRWRQSSLRTIVEQSADARLRRSLASCARGRSVLRVRACVCLAGGRVHESRPSLAPHGLLIAACSMPRELLVPSSPTPSLTPRRYAQRSKRRTTSAAAAELVLTHALWLACSHRPPCLARVTLSSITRMTPWSSVPAVPVSVRRSV